jgi:threonyl-tRNA synthetase
MKELIIHADKVSYEVTKETKVAEKITEEARKGEMEDALWVRVAVEKGDEGSVKALVEKAVGDISKVAEQVKTRKVMLYPYAHLLLGSKPSSPAAAIKMLDGMARALREREFEVLRAPFGWYKKFSVTCKGHPLSELSRVFEGEDGGGGKREGEEGAGAVSESMKTESKMKSAFYVLTPEGELTEYEKFGYSKYPGLKKFMDYETKKMRAYEKEPPHIRIMKEQEWVDYEPGTDAGNFRWYPKGRLVKKLLEKSITDFCVDYGAMEVETPIMYDYEHPSLKKYLNRFPARQYVVMSEDKEFFLRFAACFGQFLITHDMVMSHRQLPLRMFELTKYSFRREQTGELAGLKRLRGFTMPDMHGILADMNQAKEEFEMQLDAGMEWLGFVGLLKDSEVGFRVLREFYEENKEWYASLVKKVGKPILVELYEERYAYFVTKFEFNFIDAMDKASALTTVQIDVENADTYDLWYVNSKGEKQRPLITHASLSGSLERVIYSLLEKEAIKMAKGEKALLPLWLAPTQVRIIPISEKHLEFAQEVLSQIGEGVRADIDDTSETLGKKIRNAQKEWVPYVAVIGDNEVESGKVSVNIRESDEKKEMGAMELASIIKEKTQGMPFEKCSLPIELSKRPIFRG